MPKKYKSEYVKDRIIYGEIDEDTSERIGYVDEYGNHHYDSDELDYAIVIGSKKKELSPYNELSSMSILDLFSRTFGNIKYGNSAEKIQNNWIQNIQRGNAQRILQELGGQLPNTKIPQSLTSNALGFDKPWTKEVFNFRTFPNFDGPDFNRNARVKVENVNKISSINNNQWDNGIIHWDYAEYKGFEPPTESFSRADKSFKLGVYDILPYYRAGVGPEEGGKPIYYTASQPLKIGEHIDNTGQRVIDRNYTRIDYLIMPWGLNKFKTNPKLWGVAADQLHFSMGSLPLRNIPFDRIQLLDEDYSGALIISWKSAFRDPTFWLSLALDVKSYPTPKVHMPNVIKREYLLALENKDIPKITELRVGQFYKNANREVYFIDPNAKDGIKPGKYDMFVEGFGKVEVKRISVVNATLATELNKAVGQLGEEGGLVVLIRPQNAKKSFYEYVTFVRKFKPSNPKVKIVVYNESSLPRLSDEMIKNILWNEK